MKIINRILFLVKSTLLIFFSLIQFTLLQAQSPCIDGDCGNAVIFVTGNTMLNTFDKIQSKEDLTKSLIRTYNKLRRRENVFSQQGTLEKYSEGMMTGKNCIIHYYLKAKIVSYYYVNQDFQLFIDKKENDIQKFKEDGFKYAMFANNLYRKIQEECPKIIKKLQDRYSFSKKDLDALLDDLSRGKEEQEPVDKLTDEERRKAEERILLLEKEVMEAKELIDEERTQKQKDKEETNVEIERMRERNRLLEEEAKRNRELEEERIRKEEEKNKELERMREKNRLLEEEAKRNRELEEERIRKEEEKNKELERMRERNRLLEEEAKRNRELEEDRIRKEEEKISEESGRSIKIRPVKKREWKNSLSIQRTNWKADKLPSKELVDNHRGLYFEINLEDAIREETLYFEAGKYFMPVLDFHNSYGESIRRFVAETLVLLDSSEQNSIEVFIRGSADIIGDKDFRGKLNKEYFYKVVTVLPYDEARDRFSIDIQKDMIPQDGFLNSHLPNLRSSFLKQKILSYSDERIKPIILDGVVTPHPDPKDRNGVIYLFLPEGLFKNN